MNLLWFLRLKKDERNKPARINGSPRSMDEESTNLFIKLKAGDEEAIGKVADLMETPAPHTVRRRIARKYNGT